MSSLINLTSWSDDNISSLTLYLVMPLASTSCIVFSHTRTVAIVRVATVAILCTPFCNENAGRASAGALLSRARQHVRLWTVAHFKPRGKKKTAI